MRTSILRTGLRNVQKIRWHLSETFSNKEGKNPRFLASTEISPDCCSLLRCDADRVPMPVLPILNVTARSKIVAGWAKIIRFFSSCSEPPTFPGQETVVSEANSSTSV